MIFLFRNHNQIRISVGVEFREIIISVVDDFFETGFLKNLANFRFLPRVMRCFRYIHRPVVFFTAECEKVKCQAGGTEVEEPHENVFVIPQVTVPGREESIVVRNNARII